MIDRECCEQPGPRWMSGLTDVFARKHIVSEWDGDQISAQPKLSEQLDDEYCDQSTHDVYTSRLPSVSARQRINGLNSRNTRRILCLIPTGVVARGGLFSDCLDCITYGMMKSDTTAHYNKCSRYLRELFAATSTTCMNSGGQIIDSHEAVALSCAKKT